MKKCVFAGTFDPFTVGHEDTVKKCLTLFDEVIVAVAENKQKHCLFSAEERREMAAAVFVKEPRARSVLGRRHRRLAQKGENALLCAGAAQYRRL